jgi:YVTN family beta-propeller protein
VALPSGIALGWTADLPQSALADQILAVSALPGFVLAEDRAVDPLSIMKGQTLLFRFLSDRTIVESHERRLRAFDGNTSVAVRLIRFSTVRIAAAFHPDTRSAAALSLPAGATAALARSTGPGLQTDRIELAKGSIRAEIVVRTQLDGAVGTDRRSINRLLSQIARAQHSAILPTAAPLGSDHISTQPIRWAALSAVLALILLPQAFQALVTVIRDPASRRRLALRLRPRPPPTGTRGGGSYLDVSDAARRRLRAYRWRTATRTAVAVLAVVATFRIGMLEQLAMLAGLALVAVAAEAVWVRIRRTSASRAVWGPASVLLTLVGATLTMALAGAGGVLLFLYVFQNFVGSLPTEAARSFGTLLLTAGLLLIGLAAAPYTLTRRLWLRQPEQIRDRDTRDPVLLLRSWADDHLRIRGRRADRHALLERLSFRRWDRFEEIVVDNLWRHGPVIALAEPGTRLPPLGAVREVHDDDDWQDAVRTHISECVLLVVVVDRTENVIWEIREIIRLGALHKAVFVLPPVPAAEGRVRERVLGAALSLPADAFDALPPSSGQTLAVAVPGHAVLVVSDVGDDVSYEAALDAAIGLLRAAPRANPASAAPPVKPLPADLPLIRRPRGWRPPRPWYRRWPAVVWAAALLLGLFQRTLDGLPGGTSARPPIPGAVVVSANAPVAVGVGPGRLTALDASGPTLLTMGPKGRRRVVQLDPRPNGFLATASVAYVTYARSHRLSAYPLPGASGPPLWSTDLGEVTNGIAAAGRDVYVALPGSNRVAILDARTGSRAGSVQVGRAPMSLAISGDRLYVTNANDGTLSAIELSSRRVVRSVRVGAGPRGLAVAGGRALVGDIIGGRVAVVDLHSMTVIRSIPVPRLWETLASDGRVLAASSSGTGDWPEITFIDIATGARVGSVALPDLPSDLVIDGRTLLVALPDRHAAVRLPLP